MKIAELFIALGFDIKGDDTLRQVERNLVKAEGAALTMLAGVGALNLAFYAMMVSAAEAATSLEKFKSATGLSSEELQRWQLAGQKAGIQGEEMLKTITALQTAQKNVMLGQGDFSPFQFFGVSVSQDPFDMLQVLNTKLQTMDPAFGRIMASRLGISENLFQWLRRSNLELDQFNAKLLLTNQQQKSLWNLNKAWQDFLFTLVAIKNQFAESFAEPLTIALKVLKALLLVGADFIEWLNGTSIGANITKTALIMLAGALVVLMGLLTALSLVLAGVVVAVKVAALGLAPLVVAAAPLVFTLGLIIAALTALIFLFNDYWVAVHGGKSALDWSASIAVVNAMARAIEAVIAGFDRLKKAKDSIGGMFDKVSERFGSFDLAPSTRAGYAGTTIKQENNTQIHVDGSGNPAAVAADIGQHWQRTINQASGNLRQREY
jgi:hypothetical protein